MVFVRVQGEIVGMSYQLNDTAERICQKRYYCRDAEDQIIENWSGLVDRVVNFVCQSETQDFRDMMWDLIYHTQFIPNSPCLANAGKEGCGGLCACFVSPSPEDSWTGIIGCIKDFGDVARRGGGNGTCFSHIRPKGSQVFKSTHARACGPVEVMRIVSEAMHGITQSAGFRGMANMGTLHVTHPNIIDFIHCKQRDSALRTFLREDISGHYDKMKGLNNNFVNILLDKHISNFNISVMVSDAFMEAVEQDADWDFTFNGVHYGTVRARWLFNLIVENAHQNGDPGLLFDDAINRGPYHYSGQKIEATNPCVVGNSLVPSKSGWRKAESIQIGDLVFCRNKLYPVTHIEKNENYQVFRVSFSDGSYVDATASHRFKVVEGAKYHYRRLDELAIGGKVLVETFDWRVCDQSRIELIDESREYLIGKGVKVDEITQYDAGLMLGSILGDGCFSDGTRDKAKIHFGTHETQWIEFYRSMLQRYGFDFGEENSHTETCYRFYGRQLGEMMHGLSLIPATANFKKIPDRVMSTVDIEFYKGMIDGLFSTDGNVNLKKTGPMIRYTSTSLELCQQIRRILLGFGIHSRVYPAKKTDIQYNDPKYGKRTIKTNGKSWCLVIMNDGIESFREHFRISNIDRQKKLDKLNQYHFIGGTRTASVKSIEPLPDKQTVYDLYIEATDEWNVDGYIQQGCGEQPMPYYSCCNLGSIDISKFHDPVDNDVAWVRFGHVIDHCVRFLDNVIDCNVFPTDIFREWAMRNRPIGLGIMGWADLLLKLGIAYGSDESLVLAERVASFLEAHAINASIQLAKERGTPEACDYRELDHRRNVTVTSIAPTGSISQLAGCSSSIEPIYAPVTHRQDNTGKSSILHPYAQHPHFRCAVDHEKPEREVTWEQHVRMQAAFQKYGSSGISKTINMPNRATVDDVRNAYMLAWKLGCKGITIYRDGCKSVQVLNTDQGQSDNNKRPKSLPADIIRGKSDGIEWYLIIGLSDNSPYELFAISADGLKLPENGYIVKVKKRHYCLTDVDGNTLVENLTDEEQKVDEKVGHEAKRFSLEFRHGIPLKFILKQVDRSSQSIVSFSKVVGRAFKSRYLTQADQCGIVGMECPECARNGQSVSMISEAGCTKCPQCFHSKCG